MLLVSELNSLCIIYIYSVITCYHAILYSPLHTGMLCVFVFSCVFVWAAQARSYVDESPMCFNCFCIPAVVERYVNKVTAYWRRRTAGWILMQFHSYTSQVAYSQCLWYSRWRLRRLLHDRVLTLTLIEKFIRTPSFNSISTIWWKFAKVRHGNFFAKLTSCCCMTYLLCRCC